jgi:hypothetical protein
MQLKLQRSQRSAGLLGGKVAFAINARLQLTPEEEGLVRKYGLGKETVYDSEARKKHQDNIEGYMALSQVQSRIHSPGRSLGSLGRGLMAGALAALSLHVTIDSLIKGQQIETKSLPELMGAEEAVREAFHNVKAFLDTAATFDGREEVVEI